MNATLKTANGSRDFAQEFMRMAHPGEYATFDDFMHFADTAVYMSREGNDKYDPNKKKGKDCDAPSLYNFWSQVAHGHYGHIIHMLQHEENEARHAQEILLARQEECEMARAMAEENEGPEEKQSDVSATINTDETYLEKVMHKAGRCVGNICRMTFG
jgi:hypothetical protein